MQDLLKLSNDKEKALQPSVSEKNFKKKKANLHPGDIGPSLSEKDWELIFNSKNGDPIISYKTGDIIFREGEQFPFVCQIASGVCRIEKSTGAEKRVLGKMVRGEIFGEIQFLTERNASASVFAHTDVELYRIDGKYVREELFASNPRVVVDFYRYCCATLAKRIDAREKQGFGRKK